MPDFIIRNFTSEDIPQVMAVQMAYQQVYPGASVIPGKVYLSAGFAGGKNIFCAFDGGGILLGYAPLLPVLAENPDLPHTVWAEVKADPGSGHHPDVKQQLFERVVERARKITRAFPGHKARLTFQYLPSETASIEFVLSRGCTYTESIFRMMCDLAKALPVAPLPEQIEVRSWRMESEPEQLAYIRARNEVFPEAPVTLADWQSFLASPAWQHGTTLTAFDGEEIVGSVTVYWDDSIPQLADQKAGFTEYIFVRPRWRKRGIAAYLICQGLNYLKEHGRQAAFLEVRASNQHALDLYRGLGYRLVEESHLYALDL